MKFPQLSLGLNLGYLRRITDYRRITANIFQYSNSYRRTVSAVLSPWPYSHNPVKCFLLTLDRDSTHSAQTTVNHQVKHPTHRCLTCWPQLWIEKITFSKFSHSLTLLLKSTLPSVTLKSMTFLFKVDLETESALSFPWPPGSNPGHPYVQPTVPNTIVSLSSHKILDKLSKSIKATAAESKEIKTSLCLMSSTYLLSR